MGLLSKIFLLTFAWLVICPVSSSAQHVGAIAVDASRATDFRSARLALRDGKYREAVIGLNRVLKHQPELLTAYLERGRAYKKLGNMKFAQEDFARAKTLAPPTSPILDEALFEFNQVELERRLRTWHQRPQTHCNPGIRITKPGSDLLRFPEFPSKVTRTSDGWECDDGDMNLFNGLLCAAAIEEGCEAVRQSQSDVDGSWWRAPSKIGLPDPCLKKDECQSSFNSDQALGVYLYLQQKGDSRAFRDWLNFVSHNPICNTTNYDCGWPGQARFCVNAGDCAMHPIDCALVVLLGELYGAQARATQICGNALLMGVATPIQMQQWLKDSEKLLDKVVDRCSEALKKFEETFSKLKIPPPPVVGCPAVVDLMKVLNDQHARVFQAVVDIRAEVEALLQLPGPGATIAYENAVRVATANAFNSPSGPRHLAATALLVLKRINPADPRLRDAAFIMLGHSPQNALHLFLAEGPRKPLMLDAIIQKCPAVDYDPDNKLGRKHWAWEREDGEGDTSNEGSMYWDCIFAANLWKYGVQNASVPAPSNPIGLAAFKRLQEAETRLKKLVDDLTAQLAGQVNAGIGELNQIQASFGAPESVLGWLRQQSDEQDKRRASTCDYLKDHYKIECPPGIPNISLPLPVPIP